MEESLTNSGKEPEMLPESDLRTCVEAAFALKKQDIRSYSPLTLAYIGDAVYELIVRTMMVENANAPVNKLNRRASRLSMAQRQSEIIRAVKDDLTEKEKKIYKRGRNAKPRTKAKNASTAEYLRATGFEAVVGYLFLRGEYSRMVGLIRKGIELTGGRPK